MAILIVMILIPIFILLTKKYEHRFEILTGNWINTIEKCKKYLSDVDKGLMVDIKKCDDGALKKADEPKYRQLTKTAIMVVKKPSLLKRFVNKLKKWFHF